MNNLPIPRYELVWEKSNIKNKSCIAQYLIYRNSKNEEIKHLELKSYFNETEPFEKKDETHLKTMLLDQFGEYNKMAKPFLKAKKLNMKCYKVFSDFIQEIKSKKDL